MDLYQLVAPSGSVQITQQARKLTIDGVTETHQVYRIKLDLLHYNVQNDRIATWISRYKAEQGALPDSADREAYNEIIEQFIVESNPSAFNTTMKNIKAFDQREPAVVLSNGLVVDGNRRFTCLRRLSKEDPKFNWLEAVILNESLASDPRRIKMLELTIQHGEETKVDYDPIDRLVGVYNDIVKDKLFTEEEYARLTNDSPKKVRDMVVQAGLMMEFLDFINAPLQFHLAREMQVYGPLVEIPAILKTCGNEEEEEQVKSIIYTNLVVEPEHDMTRYVRRFKKILQSTYAQEFIEKGLTAAETVAEKLAHLETVDAAAIRDSIRNDETLIESLRSPVDTTETKMKGAKILETPVDNLEAAQTLLEQVDLVITGRVNAEGAKRMKRALNCISSLVEDIQAALPSNDEA